MHFRRALVLAAHPDDEMACSGTINRLVTEGTPVDLLTFSHCSDLNGPGLLDEHDAAVALLGISDVERLDIPNRRLPEFRQHILNQLDRRDEYDLILAPATFDAMQDHAAVAQEAIRRFKRTTILGYELPLNSVTPTHLSAYFRLEQIEMKLAHIALYASQADKPYMDPRYVEGLARMRGVQCGAEFAEAFEVIRWVM